MPFQFPFHRDGPCDCRVGSGVQSPGPNFQFPFHRDGPCDPIAPLYMIVHCSLSVPFSSGWALRLFDANLNIINMCNLSVPFSSGWALRWNENENGTDR